ncbi:hypothetical protein BC936DRAFT_139108 [Jimgerdemannia flammicorona]|uniref:Uncharacterized protein n=1 Tax=Jimgerdemannia flammicorona TaxID=994334 RepID=A0A433BAT3_9FUNG|nr:hypothetical protein BC936DRAFT_139108 [Jimgerdemannia flammicorona]
MLPDINAPGYTYFLNTPCKDWDALQYHEAWKDANLVIDKATVTRAFNKQVQLVLEHSSDLQKQNAERLLQEFKKLTGCVYFYCLCEMDSKIGGRVDNFWLNNLSNNIIDHVRSKVKALKADQFLTIAAQANEQTKLYAASTTKDAELFFDGKLDQLDATTVRNKRKAEDGRVVAKTSVAEGDGDLVALGESDEQMGDNNCSTTALGLASALRKYCTKTATSPYDPAHDFILDLSPSSKIQGEFGEQWDQLVADRPDVVRKAYHTEIKSIITHLFGQSGQRRLPVDLSQARTKWNTLRSLPVLENSGEFSYAEGDWEKIRRWIERATGQLLLQLKLITFWFHRHSLDAFESQRNPLQQNDCFEREWFGNYIVPLFEGVLKLDGSCRTREISVLATQRRRNRNKDVLIQQVERGHMADLLCIYEQYEVACALACGGPHAYSITKMASDEFNLPRMMKDMLDDLQSKFRDSVRDGSRLYILGIQTYMTTVRIYLMEKREVYRLHLLKAFTLPLTYSAYHNLRGALRWAWNVRGMVNALLLELNADFDDNDGFETPPRAQPNDMETKESPIKNSKKKGQRIDNA